ncbi:F-box/kelch-repeat protein At3g16740 [Eutrema salsugineum]|nr:F-box/kelch-repeat protein At3g16740 [Eutrema salsugineum]
MSDLPRDVLEEVLSRVPLKSLRSVRSTCKKWNTLMKDETFRKKHIADQEKSAAEKDEFLAIMVMDFRVYLTSVSLDNFDTSINQLAKLISLNDANHQVDISRVFHCDGLLLCVTEDMDSRLVVWDPYSGQTRWIEQPRSSSYCFYDRYALGYEMEKKKNGSLRRHKILRLLDVYDTSRVGVPIRECEIYSLKSSSWKVLRETPTCYIHFNQRGVSLKGNTYWCGELEPADILHWRSFLVCFDFTTERFGPHMNLPFHATYDDTLAFSRVREEQLAVLLQRRGTLRVEIWVTTKIEPKDVSWSKLFLEVDTMGPLSNAVSFFIDQKKEVAVAFDKNNFLPISINVAYIMGNNGYHKKLDLGESREDNCWPLACCYVPSSVQMEQPARRSKRKRNQIVY